MGIANIDALVTELAALKESLRIKLQSLANINPNYQMNAAYIARLNAEIVVLNENIATVESKITAASTPAVQPAPTPTPPVVQNPAPETVPAINPETGEQYNRLVQNPSPQTVVAVNPETGEQYNQLVVPQSTVAGVDNEHAGNSNIENYEPTTVGDEDPFEAARIRAGEEFDRTSLRTEQDVIDAYGGMQGLQGSVNNARAQQITQDAENAKTQGDWRVRLSLAPSAGYLYKAQNPGILGPLQKTDGVIFPYTPSIQVTYAAHYDASDITHSNYKIFQYKNSSVDQLNITCDFTAQDTAEANYLLAVIHFFRSVTKMFYGQDQIPKPGTPPPLCYLSGMGDFQFDRHPLAISSFNYSLPNDVDYIRASSPTLLSGVNSTGYNDDRDSDLTPQQVRMQSGTTHLNAGAKESEPNFSKATNTQPTYVPTKIQISLVAYPIVTRNDISNNFSLEKYATGKLLQGRKNPGGGGIW
jgi:hypothetical protein